MYMQEFEYIVVRKSFKIGHCQIKVQDTAQLPNFSALPQNKMSSPILQPWHPLESYD